MCFRSFDTLAHAHFHLCGHSLTVVDFVSVQRIQSSSFDLSWARDLPSTEWEERFVASIFQLTRGFSRFLIDQSTTATAFHTDCRLQY